MCFFWGEGWVYHETFSGFTKTFDIFKVVLRRVSEWMFLALMNEQVQTMRRKMSPTLRNTALQTHSRCEFLKKSTLESTCTQNELHIALVLSSSIPVLGHNDLQICFDLISHPYVET